MSNHIFNKLFIQKVIKVINSTGGLRALFYYLFNVVLGKQRPNNRLAPPTSPSPRSATVIIALLSMASHTVFPISLARRYRKSQRNVLTWCLFFLYTKRSSLASSRTFGRSFFLDTFMYRVNDASCSVAEQWEIKKVLLRERKRHTARRVMSTHSVVLSWLTPPPP